METVAGNETIGGRLYKITEVMLLNKTTEPAHLQEAIKKS